MSVDSKHVLIILIPIIVLLIILLIIIITDVSMSIKMLELACGAHL